MGSGLQLSALINRAEFFVHFEMNAGIVNATNVNKVCVLFDFFSTEIVNFCSIVQNSTFDRLMHDYLA